MKNLKQVLPKAAGIFILFTLICGVLYTGIVTGLAQLIFPHQANGSITERNTDVNFWGSSIPIRPICGGG